MDSFLSELFGECRLEYVVLDSQFRITRMSKDAAQFADTPEAAMKGADVRDAFPEIVGAESKLLVIAQTKLAEWRVRGISRTNNSAHYTIDLSVVPNIPHPTEKLVLIIEDVTERAALEQRLVQHSNETRLLLNTVVATKNYYEKILESMVDALFVTTPEGTIQTINAAASRLLGCNRVEIVGTRLDAVLHVGDHLPAQQPFANVETIATSKDGTEIPVAVTSSFIEGEEQRHTVILARDLREIHHLKTENLFLHEEIRSTHNFHEIVGSSTAIKKVFRQIEQVAATDSTVLLLGETGTGKELIAHAIHSLSPRKNNIMVKVNCAALPSSLVESELFGHEKGAFTGAHTRRVGRFEHANGSTIFLDEIGELPLETQAKLLRVLQEREFERVGGTQAIRTDVRVIVATNKSLENSVKNGGFRNDLFFRINVFPIHIPPLRERREDIPLLVQHFVTKHAQRMKKNIVGVDKKAMEAMIRYPWPGNVRELAAVIERAVILSEGDTVKNFNLGSSTGNRILRQESLSLEEAERHHILGILKEVGGVIEGPSGAAVRLDINPSTLRSKMKKLGIHRRGSFDS
jgi:formate hydrogenlyase transcriptional activator